MGQRGTQHAPPCLSPRSKRLVKPLSRNLKHEMNTNGPSPQEEGMQLPKILLTAQIQYLEGIILK